MPVVDKSATLSDAVSALVAPWLAARVAEQAEHDAAVVAEVKAARLALADLDAALAPPPPPPPFRPSADKSYRRTHRPVRHLPA
jgi:hypothetical protein